MKELAVRAATGAVYVALVLGAAYLGDVAVAALFLPVCAVGAHELWRLMRSEGSRASDAVFIVLNAVVMYASHVTAYFVPEWGTNGLIATAAALVLVSVVHVLGSGTKDPIRALGGSLLSLLVGSSFGCVVAYFAIDAWLFVGFMLMLWTNDTGAYLVGRTLGRTKLLPAVSPKKTVEGLLGGIALTVLVGLALAHWHFFLSSTQWVVTAITVAIASTIGDLFESALKRAQGVKDSGKLLPGHGGILDRFDGFLIAAPVMLIVVQWMLT